MIFGETYQQKNERHMRGVERFAWLPAFMDDGRIAWLSSYWEMSVRIEHKRVPPAAPLTTFPCCPTAKMPTLEEVRERAVIR